VTEKGYFQNGSNKLFYVCQIPSQQVKQIGFVFVHAADGNRLGPHRMFVELADILENLGFPTMRFDLTGCGDSTGAASQNDIIPDIEDVLAAVDFFTHRARLSSVCLFGISRGARVCFSTIANYQLPATGAILLSIPAPTTRAAVKSFSARLKEYIYKLKDTGTLRKLFTGRVNFIQIIKTLTVALALKRKYNKTSLTRFSSKCPLLFIYGQNDPVAAESKTFYQRICDPYKIPHDSVIIQDANHSFFHYKWKEQVFEQVVNWLKMVVNQSGVPDEHSV